MQDRLHQQARQTRRGGPRHARRATLNVRVSTAQYREHMFPFKPIIEGALEAGAHAAFLSGAGPTILAVTGGVGIADVGSDTMSQARAPLSPPRVRCLSAACADGSASTWQFLAESVSDAMVNSAKAQGATGTAHIASTSQVGISSEGIAGARLPIPARSRRDRRAARACERRCDGSQRTAPCSGRTSPSIRARGRQPYDADDLDSDGCCDDRDVLRVQCGAHFAVASRTRRFPRYTAGATRHPRCARRLYAPPSCFDEFPPAALVPGPARAPGVPARTAPRRPSRDAGLAVPVATPNRSGSNVTNLRRLSLFTNRARRLCKD